MDQTKLLKARQYYDKTQDGADKKAAALEIYGSKSVQKIENSPEYIAVVSAVSQLQREELKKDLEQVKRKQLKSYSNLLDKGEELMNEAKTVDAKILAQENQRKNLQTGVVESAIAWDGENRNQDGMDNVLEGIVL